LLKLLFWVLVALIAAASALFAASNRDPVTLALWPFGVAAEMPLYIAVLVTFVAGFSAGALVAWADGRRWRRDARRRRRRIASLERELAATQSQLRGAPTEPSSTAVAVRG
jgi:uncharacterized integral membrane protein